MPKTVVGLFENPGLADSVIREIEALGFPRKEIQTIAEPAIFEVTGVMSFPRLDFETALGRELHRIGATIPETSAYLEGLRHGGALVFATGAGEELEAAGNIMNRLGAVGIEEVTGPEPELAGVVRQGMMPAPDNSVQAGRIRQQGGGACFFVW